MQTDEFQTLEQCLLADYQPATPAETLLVHKMVLTYWRLEILHRCQDRAFESPQQVEVLERTVASNEQKYFKLLDSLKKLQSRRLAPFRRGFVLQEEAEAA